MPKREIPGASARPCAIPRTVPSKREICSLKPFFIVAEEKSNKAVIKKPISKGKVDKYDLKKMKNKNVIKSATKIAKTLFQNALQNNFNSFFKEVPKKKR